MAKRAIDRCDGVLHSPDLEAWIRETFINDNGVLFNERHKHLQQAQLGVLWTTVENVKGMRTVMGMAELTASAAMGGRWKKARIDQQLRDWFGDVPDFLITLSAPIAATLSPRWFCALSEHELTHCGQAEELPGVPKFRKDGTPVFALRGHDVEQFVNITERYGPTSLEERRLIAAGNRQPSLSDEQVRIACGNCLERAA